MGAAHGHLGLGAGLLFLIVLLWTPPHFWALALLLSPTTSGPGADAPGRPRASATAAQVLAYSVVLVAVSLLPRRSARLGAVSGGGGRARRRLLCARLAAVARADRPRAAALFHYSLLYLALLFVAVAADAAIR